MIEKFSNLARIVSDAAGSWWAFLLAFSAIVVWAVTGPFFDYSDTWQLIINTSTTIVTFLMVFLIQNTQDRDSKAVQIKLNELICSMKEADNRLIDLEHDTDEKIEEARQELVGRKTEDA